MKVMTWALLVALLIGVGGCAVDESILRSLDEQDVTWGLMRSDWVGDSPSSELQKLWDARSRRAQLNIRRVRASLADQPFDMKAELEKLGIKKTR